MDRVICCIVMDKETAVNGESVMMYKERVITCLGCHVRIFPDGQKENTLRNISE